MSKQAILGIVIVFFFTLYAINVLTANEGIGSFQTIRSSGEINQSVNVYVDRTKGFQKDNNGNIVSFFAKDKDGEQAKISLNEPVTADLANAEVVELFGHMHGNSFIAVRAKKVELANE